MMKLRGLDGPELMASLKQLVLSFEPHIREAGSPEQAEEALLHLEENDKNFHKYDFIKNLKINIDEQLGSLIDDEIEKHSPASQQDANGQDPLVTRITDHVINSKPFTELLRHIRRSVTQASEELLENFDTEFDSDQRVHHSMNNAAKYANWHYSDEEDESSYISSFNQSGLMFLNSDHYLQLADELGNTKPLEVRLAAMQGVNQIPAGDITGSEHWPYMRKNLLDVIADKDEMLSAACLKFVAKSFSCTSPKTSEIFTLLVEYLTGQFASRKCQVPKLRAGLDLNRPDMVKLMKAFRLMVEFQHETLKYWIRYPERYLEDVMTSTLALYSLCPLVTLSPLHFAAILDSKADWFIKWMHGNYSRAPLLRRLESYKSIVECAVRHCLDFVSSRRCADDMTDLCSTMARASVDKRRLQYTGAEMDYAYFIHSVHLLGRLLCFKNGRSFFPIKIQNREDPITISTLLVNLMKLITEPASELTSKPAHNSTSDPLQYANLVTEMLKGLCSSEPVCAICICKDDVTNALIAPFHQWLDGSLASGSGHAGENTLLRAADILCVIASNSKGCHHLLYGEHGDLFKTNRSSGVHVIAEFTRKALQHELPSDLGVLPSHTVIGETLYICRQLYSTCEGLLILHAYGLHMQVSEALTEATRDVDGAATPTPSDEGSEKTVTSDSQNALIWEETLKDNLLNFASTAKGILLLRLTGAINDCVFFMFTRYAKKLQVSKCEKFGYGYMVTQVAATATGMQALESAGFIRALIEELWSLLECGPSDTPVLTPKVWPVDPIDRLCHKPHIRLLNVLSSFPAVYELLSNQTLANKDAYGVREMPESLVDLIDRLIMVNTDGKIHSLFNYEQSHVCGLRLLSVLTSCLDTYLLLQCQYRFQDSLLASQAGSTVDDSKIIMIDMLSAERNYVLVKTHIVGGPTERMIPPRSLSQGDLPYPHTMFWRYPVPREYLRNPAGRVAIKQDNDLSKLLAEGRKKTDKLPTGWLDRARNAFAKVMSSSKPDLKSNTIQTLIEQTITYLSQSKEHAVFPLMDFNSSDSSVKASTLSSLQQLGVKLAVRYGVHVKYLTSNTDATDRLTHLLKICNAYLNKQQHPDIQSNLRFLQGHYPGFDWFAATLLIIMNGNVERTWKVMHKLSSLAASAYLWIPRLHNSVHIASPLSSSGISPVFCRTGHYIELILQTELPLIASAFKMSGFTPAQICYHWLSQCFWNYLDWQDICQYVCTCLCLGIDYQVYICVAGLRHMQNNIIMHMQNQNLIIFLKEEPIRGFHIGEHLEYMKSLQEKFRSMIMPVMHNFTKP